MRTVAVFAVPALPISSAAFFCLWACLMRYCVRSASTVGTRMDAKSSVSPSGYFQTGAVHGAQSHES